MKRLIPICGLWTVLTLTVGLLGVWRIHTEPIPGVPAELRAGRLGMGIGALTATGYAAFWLILTLTARKNRSQQQPPAPDAPPTKTPQPDP